MTSTAQLMLKRTGQTCVYFLQTCLAGQRENIYALNPKTSCCVHLQNTNKDVCS